MNLNATLVAQMVVFLILWWTVAKFIWPKLTATLDARALKISEGLAAAERGHADPLRAFLAVFIGRKPGPNGPLAVARQDDGVARSVGQPFNDLHL